MNIYIYGNHSFKKEINETLEHSNIKFKIDNTSLIKEINDLSELKQTIKNNPLDIYLIDDEKIIKKNSFNKKLKFLAPKDGIEEEFLLDSGIADLSVDSLAEIPKYILRKFEEQKQINKQDKESVFDEVVENSENDSIIDLDDELALLLTKENKNVDEKPDISLNKHSKDESLEDIFNIDDDINFGLDKYLDESLSEKNDNKNEISKDEFDDIMNFNDDFGLNNISFDYDDDVAINNAPTNVENTEKEEELFSMDFEENSGNQNEEFENLDFLEEIFASDKKNKEQKNELQDENNTFNKSLQEENDMNNDEFFELDSLNEKDLLEALAYDNTETKVMDNTTVKTNIPEKNNNSVNVTASSNVDELALLISKLLNNKTLEITIKIKD